MGTYVNVGRYQLYSIYKEKMKRDMWDCVCVGVREQESVPWCQEC